MNSSARLKIRLAEGHGWEAGIRLHAVDLRHAGRCRSTDEARHCTP